MHKALELNSSSSCLSKQVSFDTCSTSCSSDWLSCIPHTIGTNHTSYPSLDRLSDYMHFHAAANSSHVAFIDPDAQNHSYGQFEKDALNFAAFLLKQNLQVGDRIVYACEGSYAFFCLYMAAAMTGALLVGMSTTAPISEMSVIIRQTQPRFAFCTGALEQRVRTALDASQSKECLLISEGNASCSFTLSVRDIPEATLTDFRAINARESTVHSHSPLLLVYTSGSSGKPKGAVLTQGSIIASALEQVRHFGGPNGCTPDDIFQHQVPVNHVSGAIEWGAAPLVAGCTSILAHTFNPRLILENTQRYHATILAGVPTMWTLMFKLPNFDSFDLSSVRYCMNGAAPASKAQLERMLAIAPYCDNPLGLTETSGFCTYIDCLHTTSNQLIDTVGHVAEGLVYKICDDQRRPVETGQVGELAYRGPALFSEYYQQPIETARSIDANGFFYSGDLAYEDELGCIHLRGRNDDRYCCGSYNVYPIEAESALATHPGVDKVAVVAIPHRTLGHAGRAYIVPTANATLNPAGLKNYLKSMLSAYKIPQEYIIVDSLPLTSLGKPAKGELRQQVAEEFIDTDSKDVTDL